MPKRVLRHTETGREYEVLSIDPEKKIVVLKGDLTEFTEPLDWERFRQMGYKRATLETEEDRA